MDVDVVVIGGGPAGLTAAKEIAERGGSVAVLDENSQWGGKLLGQLHEDPAEGHWWRGKEIAEKLVKEAVSAGVELIPETVVWGLEQGWTVHIAHALNRSNSVGCIRAKAVLLATGAVEKPLPFSGWTLPGVMTIGAAQVLTNVYRVRPGKKVLVAGIDVLSLTIARSLTLAGVEVVGIVLPQQSEWNEEKGLPKEVLKQLKTMTHLAPNRWLRMGGAVLNSDVGVELAARFYPKSGMKVWGIPIQLKKVLVAVHGKEQVTGAEVSAIDADGRIIHGTSTVLPVDAVCLSGGLTPLAELAAAVGCRFARLNGLNGAVPLHGPTMETTVSNLFVAGNITGIEGAKIAMVQGEAAGKSMCQRLGIGNVTDQDIQAAVNKVKQVRDTMDIQFHPHIKAARARLDELWEKERKEKILDPSISLYA
ncbi:NAD(P)/FAD-dependent oxidoreductase [Aneurinibacillus sp. REN35]|uniref:NAD(P)/FAD-dependent oxidoreductase n=1 Tax=Aneurinibacillus sp. REN35 TaxID=3237286 RepID=UPI0035292481